MNWNGGKKTWNKINQNKEQKTEYPERRMNACIRRQLQQTDIQTPLGTCNEVVLGRILSLAQYSSVFPYICQILWESNHMNNDQPHSAKCNCLQRLSPCFRINSIETRWPHVHQLQYFHRNINGVRYHRWMDHGRFEDGKSPNSQELYVWLRRNRATLSKYAIWTR